MWAQLLFLFNSQRFQLVTAAFLPFEVEITDNISFTKAQQYLFNFGSLPSKYTISFKSLI